MYLNHITFDKNKENLDHDVIRYVNPLIHGINNAY